MKTIFTFLVIFFTLYTYGQCDNEVSTNPIAPTNLALPDSTGTLYNPDERYLNRILLEKVEELTLYILQLEERMQKVEAEK